VADPYVSGPAATACGGEAALTSAALPFDVPEGDRYALAALLGVGGMGRVYAATDTRLGRQVALKLLRVQGAHADAVLQRLVREAWVTARLDHPGIVPVHDAGRTPSGELFYTMRLVRGLTLAAAIDAATTTEARLALVRPVLEACRAVAFAHGQGYVHRDLKPANLLLGPHNETQVADWGVARHVDDPTAEAFEAASPDRASLTLHGAVVGTPAYMSPEQGRGEPPRPSADVWSLGAVLHELLVGRPPTAADVARLVAGDLPADAPPELAAITARALAPLGDRYPTAAELAEELERWFTGRRVAAYTYTPRDLARRLYMAWRAPLQIAAVGAALVVAAVTAGWLRTAAQRDRAVAAEVAAQVAQAQSRLHLAAAIVGRAAAMNPPRPEGALLAAHAVALGGGPDARGLLMDALAGPRPRREVLGALPDCARAAYDAADDELLCVSEDGVRLFDLSPFIERWFTPRGADAGFAGPDLVVVVDPDGRTRTLDRRSGEFVGAESGHAGDQTISQSRWPLAMVLSGTRVLRGPNPREELLPCDEQGIYALHVPDVGSRLDVACSDGSFAWIDLDDPSKRHRGAPNRDHADTAWLVRGDDTLWVGTLHGAVTALDPDDLQPRWRVEPGLGRVRGLYRTASSGNLVAVGDEGGAVVLDEATGATRGRLPGAVRGPLSVTATGDGLQITSFSGRHERWTVRPAPPACETIGQSLTHVAVDPTDQALWLSDASGEIYRRDPRTAVSTLEHRVGSVLKAAVPSPDGAWLAAPVSAPGPLALLSRGGEADRTIRPTGNDVFRRAGWLSADRGWATTSAPVLFRFSLDGTFTVQTLGQDPVFDVAPLSDSLLVLTRAGHLYEVDADDPAAPLVDRGAWPGVQSVAGHPPSGAWARVMSQSVDLIDAHGVRAVDLSPDLAVRGAFSPDGRWFAIGTTLGRVLVIDVARAELTARVRRHRDRVSWVAWTERPTALVSVGWDGQVCRGDPAGLQADGAALAAEWESALGLTLDDLLRAP
jgi:hypothetical protein